MGLEEPFVPRRQGSSRAHPRFPRGSSVPPSPPPFRFSGIGSIRLPSATSMGAGKEVKEYGIHALLDVLRPPVTRRRGGDSGQASSRDGLLKVRVAGPQGELGFSTSIYNVKARDLGSLIIEPLSLK